MLVVLFASIIIIFLKYGNTVEVKVSQGILVGNSYLSRNGSSYYGFLGVPFAKPPIGDLRFQPPQAAESWQGVRNATTPASPCLQLHYTGNGTLGSEDCLYLNVYTPAKKIQGLPIIFGIHGGGFSIGSSAPYNPSYIMDYDVIVVATQYRLQILGFFSTGDHVVPGNNGMKDQVMALKWVKKNIAGFGGDPNKVTILGDSAGAASVHYHIHSPLSKGLFSAAISVSGSALASWTFVSRDMARERAKALGILAFCPIKNSEKLLKCLKNIPAEELITYNLKFQIRNYGSTTSFIITNEPVNIDDAFLTENPWYNEAVNNVPWIIGVNSEEGAFYAVDYLNNNGSRAAILDANYKRLFPILLTYVFWMKPEENVGQTSETLKKFYFGNKQIGPETSKELVNFLGDAFFVHNTLEAARRHNSTVYYYCYSHRNKRSYVDLFGGYSKDLGVAHEDILIGLLNLTGTFPEAVTEGNDLKVSKRVIEYFVNFAHKRNPNGNKDIWKPVTSNDVEYLLITTEGDKMEKNLFKERLSIWKTLNLIPPRSWENISNRAE